MTAAPVTSAAELVGLAAVLRRAGTTVECEVEGTSMGHAVPAGATVRIRCDGARDAAVGAVVAVIIGGGLSVHRLVFRGRSARARGWVVTDGDANLTCDAPLPASDVLGAVEAVRGADGAWRPAGAAEPRPLARRVLAASVRGTICAGLEIHPRLARALKGAVVLAMTPLVWLRPYPVEQTRRASVSHRGDPTR